MGNSHGRFAILEVDGSALVVAAEFPMLDGFCSVSREVWGTSGTSFSDIFGLRGAETTDQQRMKEKMKIPMMEKMEILQEKMEIPRSSRCRHQIDRVALIDLHPSRGLYDKFKPRLGPPTCEGIEHNR